MPEEQTVYYADAVLRFPPALAAAFDEYANGRDPAFQFNGWTVRHVAAFAHCNYPDAFLYLDDMMKDADFAAKFSEMEFGRK